jgi:ABC-2 type transport system ATP-binding protein
MATLMSDAVEAHGVTVRRGAVLAVDSVSLVVPKSTWFGVIGANGSGKTSLLRALCGRLPCEIETCLIDGGELRALPRERAQCLGFMVPAEALPGPLTCEQVFSLIEPDKNQWRTRMGDVWQALGIDRLLGRRIATCSAGMRQRIAIGAGLLSGRGTVILDEPFNWLDPVAALDLRTALRTQVNSGLTLITALHDMITLSACDSGILLGKGKVVKTLGPADITAGRTSPFAFEQDLIEELRSHTVLD